ncbi:hypothetical protein [Actinobacillus succinogenes]|uniref:hypothetical protein n=1 Tax=Actinobacillus succinogenes TaxID=67854 RepID=UPI00031B8AC4|nr:hypothetical protein [Actinobacillus succinogenes]
MNTNNPSAVKIPVILTALYVYSYQKAQFSRIILSILPYSGQDLWQRYLASLSALRAHPRQEKV